MQLRPEVPLHEIQGNITPGFRKDFQELIFVRFPDEKAGREWVRALYPDLSSGWDVATFNRLYYALKHPPSFKARAGGYKPPKRPARSTADVTDMLRSTWLNVAFTARGLLALGADLTSFPTAFTEGLFRRTLPPKTPFIFGRMNEWTVRDSTRPTGGSGGPKGFTHAVLIVGADTEADLTRALYEQYRRIAESRIDVVVSRRGQTLGDGREHFGFRDGISQPDPNDPLIGWTTGKATKDQEHLAAPGEFILGCMNESGQAPAEHEMARYGSYLVFLRLEQDVAKFRRVMESEATSLSGNGIAGITSKQLAAKVMGRWPSGAKITPQAVQDPSPKAKPPDSSLQIVTSDFTNDLLGDGCPLFSHVRKVHPRGEIDAGAPVPTKRRRIIRRGVPYGQPLAEGITADGHERGILFLSYQASIEEQFEHILKVWANSPDFPDRPISAGWDGLIGFDVSNYADLDQRPGANYHLPGQGGAFGNFALFGPERFIRAKDGAYFFAPSIPAVAALAQRQFHP